MHHIKLVEAGIQHLDLLRHWDEQPHVSASDPNDDWNWEVELLRFPGWRQQLLAELDGRPIGFIQIIDPAIEDSHYWGEVPENLRAIDIWIGEKDDLGKGYGTIMMSLAINSCFQNNRVTAIIIDPLVSNLKAHVFYERLGFRFVENRWFNEDHCSIYRLERAHWNNRDTV
jgi:aminoglycoside 6'-N-acetyltransferase